MLFSLSILQKEPVLKLIFLNLLMVVMINSLEFSKGYGKGSISLWTRDKCNIDHKKILQIWYDKSI